MWDDVLAFAFGLLLLLVLTVVGHLLWCAFAWLIRLVSGAPKPADAGHRQCPFCEKWTTPSGNRCQWCGRDLAGKPAEELADLRAMRRQVQRLAKAGRLTAAQLVELHPILEAREQEILRPAGATPALPSAAPPAAIPPTIGTEAAVRLEIVETPPVARTSGAAPVESAAIVPPSPPPTPPVAPALPEAVISPAPPVEAKLAALPRLVERPAAVAVAPPEAVPAQPPRRPFSKVLAGFMQERNIRWGEVIALLAGAILFVGPSIALVISLWQTLTQTPLLTYSIFVAYFSGVFGIGLFWYHRWKLEHVGRTMLIIATLLVPLYFWIMVSLSKQQWSLGSTAAELASLAIFAWLVGLAGRVLVPGGRWYQVAGVVLNAGAVPLAVRLPVGAAQGPAMVASGMIPVLVFLAAVGGYLYSLGNRRTAVLKAAPGLFTLLGTAGFSLIVALGLLVNRAVKLDGLASVMDHLAVPALLASLPLLAAGLSVIESSGGRRSLAGFRVAGTAVGLLGAAGLLAAVVMAWPDPAMLVAVGSLAAAALVYVAFRYRLPLVHAGAVASAILVYLVGYHLLAGHLTGVDRAEMGRRMLELALQAQTGLAMVGLAAILAAVSELLARRGRRHDSVIYLGGCGVVAAAGLLLVSVDGARTGGADALRAAILYAVYGAGSLALTARWRRLGLSYLGLVLATSAALWVLWSQSAAQHVGPGWGAVLAIEALVMAAAAAVLQRYAAGVWYDPWNMVNEDRLRELHASQRRPLAGRSVPPSAGPFGRGGRDARRGADRVDGLVRLGDYRRFPHAGADRRQPVHCRGLFPPGLALSLVPADVGRFVDHAGRHGPRAEFQLFPQPRSQRPQLDDSAAGPRHVCRVGRAVPRPASFRGRGGAAGRRRAAGQHSLALVGACATGARSSAACAAACGWPAVSPGWQPCGWCLPGGIARSHGSPPIRRRWPLRPSRPRPPG